ncbi:9668_t:CDS:2 [Funneliformis mosseae]|uniref:9668_t:CDS:1 n=1 Tax=Funneliformis mosseae TaxID=27381 RepID=A0A9N9E318_FUNMO|nr:9668_t:CDS:2 [Funneliformis mosseae]
MSRPLKFRDAQCPSSYYTACISLLKQDPQACTRKSHWSENAIPISNPYIASKHSSSLPSTLSLTTKSQDQHLKSP